MEVATGDIYTDGSALGAHWRVCRAGWAAVALSKEGKIQLRMGGIATALVTMHVDNATVVSWV